MFVRRRQTRLSETQQTAVRMPGREPHAALSLHDGGAAGVAHEAQRQGGSVQQLDVQVTIGFSSSRRRTHR